MKIVFSDRRPWTAKQDKFLDENYGKLRTTELVTKLRKSACAIYMRAHKRGLAKPIKVWSKKDTNFLVKNYNRYRPSYIANKISRTPQSVYAKASSLGLT